MIGGGPPSADFGVLALLCSIAHGACHIVLSALQRRPGFLLETSINRSGLVALLLLLAVGLPMSLGFIRAKVRALDWPSHRTVILVNNKLLYRSRGPTLPFRLTNSK